MPEEAIIPQKAGRVNHSHLEATRQKIVTLFGWDLPASSPCETPQVRHTAQPASRRRRQSSALLASLTTNRALSRATSLANPAAVTERKTSAKSL